MKKDFWMALGLAVLANLIALFIYNKVAKKKTRKLKVTEAPVEEAIPMPETNAVAPE